MANTPWDLPTIPTAKMHFFSSLNTIQISSHFGLKKVTVGSATAQITLSDLQEQISFILKQYYAFK